MSDGSFLWLKGYVDGILFLCSPLSFHRPPIHFFKLLNSSGSRETQTFLSPAISCRSSWGSPFCLVDQFRLLIIIFSTISETSTPCMYLYCNTVHVSLITFVYCLMQQGPSKLDKVAQITFNTIIFVSDRSYGLIRTFLKSSAVTVRAEIRLWCRE